jgi:hypothetical protein
MKSKRVALGAMLALFIWEFFNMTGLSIAGQVIVVSAFIDEPIDVPFVVVYGIGICLFIWRERIGKWVCLVWLFFAALIQGAMYFHSDFSGYYAFFANEGTHRIFPPSDVFLVKDTYHIVIDILILTALISVIMFHVASAKRRRKARKSFGN